MSRLVEGCESKRPRILHQSGRELLASWTARPPLRVQGCGLGGGDLVLEGASWLGGGTTKAGLVVQGSPCSLPVGRVERVRWLLRATGSTWTTPDDPRTTLPPSRPSPSGAQDVLAQLLRATQAEGGTSLLLLLDLALGFRATDLLHHLGAGTMGASAMDPLSERECQDLGRLLVMRPCTLTQVRSCLASLRDLETPPGLVLRALVVSDLPLHARRGEGMRITRLLASWSADMCVPVLSFLAPEPGEGGGIP